MWHWRSLLRVPWTAQRSNQSILKEISPGCSLEELMLKLKLQQHFGHLMQRVASLGKTLMLGKIEGRRRRGLQGMRWLDGITNSMDMGLGGLGIGDGQGCLACCGSWARKSQTRLSNWTELNWIAFNRSQDQWLKIITTESSRLWPYNKKSCKPSTQNYLPASPDHFSLQRNRGE